MDLNNSLHNFFIDYDVEQWLSAQGQDGGPALEEIMASLSNQQDFAECK
jgi:hypothetical protein